MHSFLVNLIIYPVPIRRVGRANRAEFFCEELSTLLASSRTVIIQTVTAVQGNNPWLRRIALRSFLAGVGLLGIAYAADYGVFRCRLATKRQPFGSVTVEHYYQVAHKDGKAELIFDPPVQKTCVHSLFPHSGDPPCWFLSRHVEQKTDL